MAKKNKTTVKAVITKGVIKCPFCGYELAPEEVFISKDLLGTPENIVRDPLGKIIVHEYKEDCEPGLTETYECENCGKPFIVEATISYKSKSESEENDFTNLKSSLL